jgi:hypothetical protein
MLYKSRLSYPTNSTRTVAQFVHISEGLVLCDQWSLKPALSPVILPNAQRQFVPWGQQSGSELDHISPITPQPGFYDLCIRRSLPSASKQLRPTTYIFAKSITSWCSICERRWITAASMSILSSTLAVQTKTQERFYIISPELRLVIAVGVNMQISSLMTDISDNASRFSQWWLND